jgi:N6-adenosine-specific RNA methylase IME4
VARESREGGVTRYRTIVADPPWDYPEGFATVTDRPHKQDRDKGVTGGYVAKTELPYPSMSLAQIEALPVADLAAPDARLFLWATMRYLTAAFDLLPVWGFKYRQLIVWDKTPNIPPFGGSVAPNAAEFLIVATRGKPRRMDRWGTSVIRARRARTTHSAKPDVFIDLAETVSEGPYLELFARRARFGWDYWGDQSLGTADMEAA